MSDNPSDSAEKFSPEDHVAASLLAASLLAFTGGILDAFLYVAHGKVFAGAMTGNAILTGIALLGGKGPDILHHLLPILAFLLGIWLAEMVQTRAKPHHVTLALAAEALGLLAASFLPNSFPEAVFIFTIALLSAFQVGSFRNAESYSYNSTFITGDLRTFTVGLRKTLDPGTRSEGVRQARDLGLVVLTFLVGALTGATLAPRYANRTLWLPSLLIALVFAMALHRSLQHARENKPRLAHH